MATIPPQQYNVTIRAELKKASDQMRRFMIAFLQDFNEQVVMATPVDTGYLRGSWSAGIGGADATGGPIDPSGGATVAKINLAANQIQFGDSYHLVNGAHYAAYVEFGTSRMAPRFFLRGVVDRAQQIADEAKQKITGPGT